ncbi:hypothetical protein BX600DRAFT_417606 [Xylariales sp. PMI_506]|nr:hypothetical protein BX600DRAFT_417606 [Xylariales sp. PMI_506]
MAPGAALPLDPSYKPSVHIAELPSTASVDEIIAVIDRDGGVILTDFVSSRQLTEIDQETQPYIQDFEANEGYSIIPKETVVLNGLVGKSPTIAQICEHPHLTDLRNRILSETGSVAMEDTEWDYHIDPLLSVSMSFRIGYGAPRQRLHRDDTIHLIDHSQPYSLQKSSQFACLIAACETKQENGATMFVPGSHRWDGERRPKVEEVTFAEMKPGSALIFLAGAYHGGGHNSVSGFTRIVHGLFFCRGTLRTEENQFLTVPRSQVLSMSTAMQSLLGYKIPKFLSLGVVEGNDPMANLKEILVAANA